jgi:hypothetical protein
MSSSSNGSKKAGAGKPAWRSLVDSADRLVTPAANSFVRTDAFADLVSTVTRLEVRLRRRMERQATWYWHQLHLPSSGDIRRVSSQLAALEARVRDVSERLEDHEAASQARARKPARAKASKTSKTSKTS